MKLLLGIVKNIEDEEYRKRIQAEIIGMTDGVPSSALPWAFPLDDQCVVPAVGDTVKLFVDKENHELDYDYNRLWYEKWTETTYPECYELDSSDSYSIKDSSKRDLEPAPISSTTYPKNRVQKISKITIEFDEQNKRYCLTDENGNYIQTNNLGMVLKSIKELYIGSEDNLTIDSGKDILLTSEGDTSLESQKFLIEAAKDVQVKSSDGITLASGTPALTESMVLGDTLDAWLGNLVTWLSTHIHGDPISGTTLAPLGVIPPKIGLLSQKNKNN